MAERTLVTRQVGPDALTRRFMQVQDPFLRQAEPGLAAAQASKALTLGALLGIGMQKGSVIPALDLGEVPAGTSGKLSADGINPIKADTASIQIQGDSSQGGFSAFFWRKETTYETEAEAINDLGSLDEKKLKKYQEAQGDQHAGIAIDTSVVLGAEVGAHDPSDEIHLEVDFAPASSLVPGVYTATLVYKENQIDIWSQQLTAHVIVQQVAQVSTSTPPELVLKYGGLVDVPVTVTNTGAHPVVFHFSLAQGPFGIILDTKALVVPAGTTKQESITCSAVIEQDHIYEFGPQEVVLNYYADGAGEPQMSLTLDLKPGVVSMKLVKPLASGVIGAIGAGTSGPGVGTLGTSGGTSGATDFTKHQGDVFTPQFDLRVDGAASPIDFYVSDVPTNVVLKGISINDGGAEPFLPQNQLVPKNDSKATVTYVFSIGVDAEVVTNHQMTIGWHVANGGYGSLPLHLTIEYLQKDFNPSGTLEGNGKVSASTEFLTVRSDGTWAWRVKLHSDSTWSSDNYVVGFQFTFADGGSVKFGIETMNISPGNDDTYTFGGLSDGPTAQLFKSHWVDLATNKATGLSITGHSAGQPLWKIFTGWVADGYKWTKEHPAETAAALDALSLA